MKRPLRTLPFAASIAAAALLSAPARAQTYVPQPDLGFPKVQYTDSTVSMNDRCPVRHAKLNTGYKPVYVNGRPIGFCCTSCPGTFVQEPEKYLKEVGVRVPSLFKGGKPPVLDSSLRAQVNFEIYFFASAAEKKRFLADPSRYCGKVTDPITYERFRPTAASPKTTYGNRLYYFASDSTRAAFLADPVTHKDRRTGTT
jgi:YHS domain-containing protein